jgi:hypothetical protein
MQARSRATWGSALLVVILGAGLGAQTPPVQAPPAKEPTPAGQSPAQQPPSTPPASKDATQTPRSGQVFQSRVDLVTTDVIVRDNNGQFVADLNKDDFEVYEDGVKQELVSFTLTHVQRRRATTAGC